MEPAWRWEGDQGPTVGSLSDLAKTMFLQHHTPRQLQVVVRKRTLSQKDLVPRPNSSASGCENGWTIELLEASVSSAEIGIVIHLPEGEEAGVVRTEQE